MELEVERDFASADGLVRAFRQHVDDQLVTLFGVEICRARRRAARSLLRRQRRRRRRAPAVSAGVRTAIASRVHGSVDYSVTQRAVDARPTIRRTCCSSRRRSLRPSASGSTTSRRRSRPRCRKRRRASWSCIASATRSRAPPARSAHDAVPIDARFDVQVRQSLPFMDFSSAQVGDAGRRSAISSAKPPPISRSTTSCSSSARRSASSAA